MNARNTARRAIDGVLLLDKPAGITSSAAVQKVRRLLSAAKAGHTGTLDPQATGLLPVCLGEATKFAHLLLDANKRYVATVRLGMTTDTGDLEGKVLARGDGGRSREEIEAALGRFRGPVQQTPPMYSAVKHDGERLYRLARAGTEVAREPRGIFIHELELEGVEGEEITLSVTCSKGTYVRVLAEDIGKALGCGACLAALRREAVGGMTLAAGAVTLGQLEDLAPARRDAQLLPPDTLVATLPRLDLDATEAGRILRGQAVQHDRAGEKGLARIYGPDRAFLGVVEITNPGQIQPRRLRRQGLEGPGAGD
jgi:tRNA pseudouridine55 synthase